MMAGSVLTVLPVLIVFLLLQRAYVRGVHGGEREGMKRAPCCVRRARRAARGAGARRRRRAAARRRSTRFEDPARLDRAPGRRRRADARRRRRAARQRPAPRLPVRHAAAATPSLRRALDLDAAGRTTASPSACAATAPPQNLEFKLIDATRRERVVAQPARLRLPARRGRRVTIRKRQIEFAWGPAGRRRRCAAWRRSSSPSPRARGGARHGVARRPELTPLPVPGAAPPPRRGAAPPRARAGDAPRLAVDGDAAHRLGERPRRRGALARRSTSATAREFGGLVVDWAKAWQARPATWSRSRTTARAWRAAAHGGGRDGGARPRSTCPRPRRATCGCAPPAGAGALARRARCAVMPLEWSAHARRPSSARVAARRAARRATRAASSASRSYWTVVGADGDRARGAARRGRRARDRARAPSRSSRSCCTRRPAAHAGRDVRARRRRLEDGYLPIPSVRWPRGDLRADRRPPSPPATRAAAGAASARYRVAQRGHGAAARPRSTSRCGPSR